MKIKTLTIEAVVQRSRSKDYGPQVDAIIKALPAGHVVDDTELWHALAITKRMWWNYLAHYREGPVATCRCYMNGRSVWGAPATIEKLIERGAVKVRRPGYDN